MAKVTPQEFASDWSTRIGQSIPKIERGIRNVTTSPTQKAKAKKQKLLNNFTNAVNSGKWERGLDRVSLSDWQTAAITKGLSRIGQGAQAAQSKVEAFATKLLAYQDGLKAKLDAMPDLTLQDNINRMTYYITEMSKFKNG